MSGKFCNKQSTINYKLFTEAKRYIPGGVNSPARSFKAVDGEPIFIKRAKGSKLYSEGGQEFIDYCMSWGASILGHSHPAVVSALQKAIKQGTSFGAATRKETELAKVITQAIPSIEQVRLTNSGTEAVMAAMKLAAGFTGKEKFIRFKGSYHGWSDYKFYSAEYNDLKTVEGLIKKYKIEIAAIIVEPIGANNGVTVPQDGFLKGLKKISDKYGILLIFDEVVTGFRLIFAGAQDIFCVRPDLTCLGKIIGGGLPIGAVGGRKDIMKLLAPQGDVYQAGTFSGNPLTVTAGLVTLKTLSEERPYSNLEKLTKRLCENIGLKTNFIGSMFSISCDYNLFKRFYRQLLKEGVYFSPSISETNFLSTAHTAQDIDKTINAVERTK